MIFSIMRVALLALLIAFSLHAQEDSADPLADPRIVFQNSILVKVNGKTVSVMDVKKKLDFFFHKNYPHLLNTPEARYQFYQQSWRNIVAEIVDHELILADAESKEVKLTDGEIREELERRFGPNTLATLEKLGLTFDDAWKMIREEMIVQRMTWWFVQSKAIQKVTPEDIRHAYRSYLKDHPSYDQCKYRVISIRGEKAKDAAEKISAFLAEKKSSPEVYESSLNEIVEADGATVHISSEITANDKDMSEAHKKSVSPLSAGEYSEPVLQTSRFKTEPALKIFYCIEKSHHPAPSFEQLQNKLREELIQAALLEQSSQYIEKLRKYYGFDAASLRAAMPNDFQPFSIQ